MLSRKRAIVVPDRSDAKRRRKNVLYVPTRIYRNRFVSGQTYPIQCKLFPNLNITASSTGIVAGSVIFTLQDVSDNVSYINAFDQYRLVKVKVYTSITQPGQAAAAPAAALFATCCDQDDAITPTTFNSVMNHDDSVVHPHGKIFVRTIYPRFAQVVETAGTTPAAVSSQSQWLDTSSPDAKYYSLKYCWSQCTSTNVFTCQMWFQYFLEFKRSR